MSDTKWLNESEMAAWMAYVAATHLLERRIEEQLKADSGLTHAQYEILAKLSQQPGGRVRMTELANRLIVSKSGLTYQIGQLERMGLVTREACPSDERGVLAVLTEKGVRCLERTAPGHVAVVRAFLIDRLTPEEVETMRQIMTKATAAMEAAPTGPPRARRPGKSPE
ncbi:MarR family winged helix-turn-helix transcriptional regulator [Streptosporangium vulgare]|uniref:MarR family winged helix-turn-helix transcriptional regulator n=2 Tax=Streptosporangium vulgare TaxID=46190 RepID=A0ABV5TI25_9ACTN